MDKKKKMGKVLEFKPRKKGRVNSNRNVRAIPKEQPRNSKEKIRNNPPTEEDNILENKTQKNIAYFLLLCFVIYVFKSYF